MSGARFRPGQPGTPEYAEQKKKLREANPHLVEDSFWPDGNVRVTGREYNGVARSPCFQGGEFSCFSCHEMHPAKTDPATLKTWAVGQMKSDTLSDQACVIGLTLFHVKEVRLTGATSVCLTSAAVLLPAGFFLSGVVVHGGDPGSGILMVPVGAFLFCMESADSPSICRGPCGPPPRADLGGD